MPRRRVTLLCVLALLVSAKAQPAPYQTPDAPQLGSAWYPEQWPESAWERDLALMEQAHFTVVRIGEFAWSSMEPQENHFTLEWLDHAIALAAKHHLKVVLGTPTDAPPAWLTTHYPETLGTNADGHLREHGGRRQFSYASPKYRELCAHIVTQLAQRYGHNPNVLGWQIGNEYTDESFDPATRTQFQQFLKARYKTLASLNDHWATAYWSQTYTDWSQIPLATTGNPGLLLEHKHFVTATWRSFQRVQIDALRPRIDPHQFITTNIGGLAWSDNWDHSSITQDLDLASWDEYVGTGHLDSAKEAMLNDFVRGWKRQNFWIMETQPATVNWSPLNNALYPGETRALAWQAVGHGADAILYWQWRAALNGQEQYHGAIVGPDGKPNPLYSELQQLGAEFARTRAALTATRPHAEVALLHTYDSRWAIDFQPHSRDYDQQAILTRFHTALAANGRTVDIIDPTQPGDLTRYKLLVAPSLNVISESLAAKLLAYINQGGHLLLGPRSGMKDEYNSLNPQRQPGPLAAALGAKVEQYYALSSPIALDPGGDATIWAEHLTPTSPDTHVLLTYTDPGGWLDHQPAFVARKSGKGSIAYLGTLPTQTLFTTILTEAIQSAGLSQSAPIPLPTLPVTVEVSYCTGPQGPIAIIINHGDKTFAAPLPSPMHDLLSAQLLHELSLPPQGVAVLTPEPAK